MLTTTQLKLIKEHAHFSMQQSDMIIQLAETAQESARLLSECNAMLKQVSTENNVLNERLDQDEATIQHKDMQLSQAAKTINGLNAENSILKKQVEELKALGEASGGAIREKKVIEDDDLPWDPTTKTNEGSLMMPYPIPAPPSRPEKNPGAEVSLGLTGPVDPPMGG